MVHSDVLFYTFFQFFSRTIRDFTYVIQMTIWIERSIDTYDLYFYYHFILTSDTVFYLKKTADETEIPWKDEENLSSMTLR